MNNKKQKKWSKEQIQALKNDLLENYGKPEFDAQYFAKKYNYVVNYIYARAAQLKLNHSYKQRNIEWLNQKDAIIYDYTVNKIGLKPLGKKYKHFSGEIKKRLIEWGIYIRNTSEAIQTYEFDKSFFKKIDTEEKAYWLGFIVGDGNLYLNEKLSKSVFQVCLGKQDEGHLWKLKNSLKSEHKFYNDKTNIRFMINSKELAADLQNLGVTPKKSLTTKFPTTDIVPEHLMRHFIRGYFDADGSIFTYKDHRKMNKDIWGVNIVGVTEFIQKINEFIGDKTGVSIKKLALEKRKADQKLSYLNYGGSVIYSKDNRGSSNRKSDFEKIYDFFYKDATIWLDRKKEKFDFIKKLREENND